MALQHLAKGLGCQGLHSSNRLLQLTPKSSLKLLYSESSCDHSLQCLVALISNDCGAVAIRGASGYFLFALPQPVTHLPSLPSSLAVLVDQNLCANSPSLQVGISAHTQPVSVVSASLLDHAWCWLRQGHASPPAISAETLEEEGSSGKATY